MILHLPGQSLRMAETWNSHTSRVVVLKRCALTYLPRIGKVQLTVPAPDCGTMPPYMPQITLSSKACEWLPAITMTSARFLSGISGQDYLINSNGWMNE